MTSAVPTKNPRPVIVRSGLPVGTAARPAVVTAMLTDSLAADPGMVPEGVSGLEVCADVVGDIDPDPWRRRGRTLTYSLRSASRGGQGPEPGELRWRRLVAAAHHYDVVDLEADHDLVPQVLSRIPPRQRRISWQGGAMSLPALRQRFERMAGTAATLYLLAPEAATCAQAVVPAQLLARVGRRDVTAYATGPAGVWTRVLAPFLGAPVVFGQLRRTDDAAVPTVGQLLKEYAFPALPPLSSVYGIVGSAANRSLSPLLHNRAYRALGLPHLFLPFQCEDLTEFWESLVTSGLSELGLPVHGLTVTAPLKAVASGHAVRATRRADVASSANLLVMTGTGRWRADTTDGSSVMAALHERDITVLGVPVAVIGCGGAGRTVASELIDAGARVTLVNRGEFRGRYASQRLGVPFVPLSEFDPTGYFVLVNATPVRDAVPFGRGALPPGAIVLDFVYAAEETALTRTARGAGLTTVDGWEILLREVRDQFQLMTGHRLPRWVTEDALRPPTEGALRPPTAGDPR